jgi:sugar lactone lactonase YvrE
MLRVRALVLVLAATAAANQPAPSEVDRLRGYLAVAKGHGGLMFRLAQALAKGGQGEEAVRWLKAGLDQGLDLDLGDAAFLPLRGRPDFDEQRVRADAVRPVSTSRLAFRIPQPDLIPEGIAWDAKTGDFFVGSLYKKKIVRIGVDGRARDFVAEGRDGLEDVLGLKVDPQKRRLWACTAGSARAGGQAGASGLLLYDVDSGKLLGAHWLREAGVKHLLNDLAFSSTGEVFVTDSEAETLYRLAVDGERLEPFIGPGTFRYPNGLALAADEKRLYLADFEHGLSVVELATRASRPLPHPVDVSTHGIDGLSRHENDLIAVQNGAGRDRILRYRLSPEGDRILKVEVLESRNPLFRIPTTGVVAGDDFVYLANANLDALAEDGGLKKDAHLEEVVVLRTPLR